MASNFVFKSFSEGSASLSCPIEIDTPFATIIKLNQWKENNVQVRWHQPSVKLGPLFAVSNLFQPTLACDEVKLPFQKSDLEELVGMEKAERIITKFMETKQTSAIVNVSVDLADYYLIPFGEVHTYLGCSRQYFCGFWKKSKPSWMEDQSDWPCDCKLKNPYKFNSVVVKNLSASWPFNMTFRNIN